MMHGEERKFQYKKLDPQIQERILADRAEHIENPYRCHEADSIRRNANQDKGTFWRPAFLRDVEKILHLPYYNRYTDKTQVFSLYRNDDISRRALHVQLVSRIARNIGGMLGLNLDLIEAIALGHDLGHTPFGHTGERFLDALLRSETGRYFNHNVQSARVLDRIFVRNISLQCLDGILCHNGEFEQQEYRPDREKAFTDYDAQVEACYREGDGAIKALVPKTLEGCVVRISDMIAYIGKDRQDAETAQLIDKKQRFRPGKIGTGNAPIINNISVDIVENSYGKDHILLSPEVYGDLKAAKAENYEVIYKNDVVSEQHGTIREMFADVYYKLLDDLKKGNRDSVIYRHHLDFIAEKTRFYDSSFSYGREEANQMVVDYMASMTDDYFIELHHFLFPESPHKIEYISYFEDLS